MTEDSKNKKNGCIKILQQKIARIGVLFAILGCLLFAVSEACAKFIAQDVEAEVVISIRYIIHGFATAPFLIKIHHQLPTVKFSKWIYALIGGLSTGATTYVANYSYHYIPLMDSFVIMNSQPIFAAIIAWFWLKEKLTFYDACLIILTLVGVVVACQPSFLFGSIDTVDSESRLIGSMFSVLCSVLMAIVTCFSRNLKTTPSPLISYMQGIGGVLIGFVGGMAMNKLYLYSTLFPIQYIALFFAGVLGFVARGCFTLAVQTEDATLIAVLQTLEIPASFLAQLIMLDTYPNALSVVGALIVMVSTALLITKLQMRRKLSTLKESFKAKIRPVVKKRDTIKETEPLIVKRDIEYN